MRSWKPEKLTLRRWGALLLLPALAMVAWGAWVVGGTTGLVVATLAAVGLGVIGVVQQNVRSERRITADVKRLAGRVERAKLDRLRRDIRAELQEYLQPELEELRRSVAALEVKSLEEFGTLRARLVRPEEQFEQVLRSISAAYRRIELMHERSLEVLGDRHQDSIADLNELLDVNYRQIEQLIALYYEAAPIHSLPALRGWAASPDLQRQLFQHVRQARPSLVFECGGGVSTLVLGRALELNGHGRLVSVEHADTYSEETRQAVKQHGLEDRVAVHHSPLIECVVENEPYQWYDLEVVRSELNGIDLALIDGPPGDLQRHARFPALPLLRPLLNPGAVLYLDDSDRRDETEILNRWQELYSDIHVEHLEHEKGTAVITYAPQG